MYDPEYTILGAGLAGISTSYHLGHDRCVVFEKKPYAGGHVRTYQKNGFTWDEGPHVSFTKSSYVKDLFAASLDQEFLEYKVFPTNYYRGNWIPHPAQSHLYKIPEPLRTACFDDFINTRKDTYPDQKPTNYAEWLNLAFGETFAANFPAAYTRKYWTVDPSQLTTEWVGNRVFFPDVETVKKGYAGDPDNNTHYITSVRYPKTGGYNRYTSLMEKGIRLSLNKEVSCIDLENKNIMFSDGEIHAYKKLVSTLPLPEFIKLCNAPADILEAASALWCSQLLILNFEVAHPATRTEQWLYIYDEELYSTRINFTELLSPQNAPANKCGIQVEVYFSKYRPLDQTIEQITKAVSNELLEMKLVNNIADITDVQTHWIPYANVIFDLNHQAAADKILNWLSLYGLKREEDDLHPMTDWEQKEETVLGDLVLAGRFGQWKYYWTDDCVLRGKYISDNF